MESIVLTSNKSACAFSPAVAVTDDKPRKQMDPLPWLNHAICQSQGSRKRSHRRAFDPVLTVTSTDVGFSSTFLKDTTDSAVSVSSQTLLDKRPHRTAENGKYIHIGSDNKGNSNHIVAIEQRDNLSNYIGIQGTYVSNIKEMSCIVTSKTNTDMKKPLHEPDKHKSNSECASQSIIQQENGNSQARDNSKIEHNLNEMEIIRGSSNATIDVHLNSTPSSTKKERKRKHTQLELKIHLISVNQAPLNISHFGAKVTNSPCPCRKFTKDIDPPSTSNDFANQLGSRDFNVDKLFASRAETNREKINPDNIKNAENYLYQIRQSSVLCKPSSDRYSRDQLSPLAEGYKLQDGVFKIPCLTDGSNVEKSYYWEESLNRSSISKKSKMVPLVQQQNIGCLTSQNIPDQIAMPSAPCSGSATDKNITKQKSTTEITYEIRGLHLNDRALQASASSSSSSSSSLSIINEDSWHKGSHKASKKAKTLKSDKKKYKSIQKIKNIIDSRHSERLMDIENLAQRIENMSTMGSLNHLTASASFNKNEDKYCNTKSALSKPKGAMTETSKELPMNPTVFLQRLTGVTSDIPVKLSLIYGLDRDREPSNYPVPLHSKQSKVDVELVNLNNSSSEKITTNLNAGGAAADNKNEAVTKEVAVREGSSFNEDKDKVVSRVKTTCFHTLASNTKLQTQSALLSENTSSQEGGERTRQQEKLGSKFVSETNVVTTTREKYVMSGKMNTQKTSDFSMFTSKHIFTAVIVNKEDTNSEETVCTSDSTELLIETTNRKSNISSSTVHALVESEKNKQSRFKTTHLVPQIIKRKDKTVFVPIPLTPHIYRYLVENAGVVVKPFIPPASRTRTNQIIGTFRINNKSNVSNPTDSKCIIPTKTKLISN